MCPQKYYLSYVLGLKDKENLKANMGSVIHKAMEILARKRVAQLNNKRKVETDFGKLTFKQCDDIEYITSLAYDMYKELTPQLDWTEETYDTCVDWVFKAVLYNNGMMDPRKQNVITPELYFDIDIKEPWAKFDYNFGKKRISGFLSIKGTIDLIIKETDNQYHMIDYKGLPLDTSILTTNGWSTMGNLRVGDKVFDQFLKPTKVTGKSQASEKPCFYIEFTDESEVYCDHEHLWLLSDGRVVEATQLKPGDQINKAGGFYRRTINFIRNVPPKVTQCISVDSPDNTYLCTEFLIPTHNSGKRLNWATGKEKTQTCLEKDMQLLLYYYALKNLYPDKEFFISIYYINDGGVFTFPFDETDYTRAENMIKQKFQYIQSVQYPMLISQDNSNFKCKHLCAFSQPFDRSGKSICHYFRDEIKKKGIDQVTLEHANFDKIQKYGQGGGRLVNNEKTNL